MPTLSIILPTLNCRDLVSQNILQLNLIGALAVEIIVVDSQSNDGTVELIKQELRHPRIKFFSQPKGLYESWNFAVNQCRGDWIYFSTAGDTIEYEMLEYLINLGEKNIADVVISNPFFVDENGGSCKNVKWPLHKALTWLKVDREKSISKELGQLLSIEAFPCALLGSSASNIYRRSHLSTRPFPAEFGHGGDAIWCIRYAHETNFCLSRVVGSKFTLHRKPNQAIYDYDLILSSEIKKLRSENKVFTLLDNFIKEILPLKRYSQAMHKQRSLLWRDEKSFLRPLFQYLLARQIYKNADRAFRSKALGEEDKLVLFSK